jgi:hypothetical protein
MTPYKLVPLVGGKFALAINDGGEHPTLSGPYKTKSAARAHMAEYERLARIVSPID